MLLCCVFTVTLLDTASLDSLDWQSHIGGGGRGVSRICFFRNNAQLNVVHTLDLQEKQNWLGNLNFAKLYNYTLFFLFKKRYYIQYTLT